MRRLAIKGIFPFFFFKILTSKIGEHTKKCFSQKLVVSPSSTRFVKQYFKNYSFDVFRGGGHQNVTSGIFPPFSQETVRFKSHIIIKYYNLTEFCADDLRSMVPVSTVEKQCITFFYNNIHDVISAS